jgi:prepilin-type N-terminal cleavage/methylation domain-containing protein
LIKRKRGFTLLEVIVALAVTVLIMPAIVAALIVFMTIPGEEGNELTAIHNVRTEADWITLDGMRAREFSPGSGPVYGTFYWEDYTIEPADHYEVEYRFKDGKLMRNETVKSWDGVDEEWVIESEKLIAIARYMGNSSDVEFFGNVSPLEVQLHAVRGDQSKELTIQVKSRIILSGRED